MVKMKGLGRGLDALLGSTEEVNQSLTQDQSLPVNSLSPGKYQPRLAVNDDSITELAESIRSQGIIQPLIVRRVGGDSYEIIAGERRWRAAKQAGLDSVPVIIKEVDDNAALAMALIENIQREDLNVIDEALGIKRLIEEFGLTHEGAANVLGKSRASVTNAQRLLQLTEEVQVLLKSGKIEMGHARALVGLESRRQKELATRIVALGLSVRDAESLARKDPLATKSSGTKSKSPQRVDRDLVNLQTDISESLGTSVKINANKKGAGKLTIAFSGLEELDAILAKLRHR